MAKLLVKDRWFQSIRSRSWLEKDYESVVVANAAALFPEWICIPFFETVEGEDGTRKRPDLALVDRHYRVWWVVEVELAHHDLHGHVVPQVKAFRTGHYGPAHAAALLKRNAELDRDRLEAMMRGLRPNVLVIVDSPSVVAEWHPQLRSIDVSLATVEPFLDPNNELILRLNGDQPDLPGSILTRCSRHPSIRRLWKVHSPATLPASGDDAVPITYQGVVTEWRVVHLHDAVMLQAVTIGDVLEELKLVDLSRADDGHLVFTPVASTRSRRRI